VTLGGTDIRALDSGEVRSVIGLCEQDAHVFDSTLEANLRLAKPSATVDELRSALARARLLAWTDSLPLGLATPVGEHGARLSGGQRQRLALARVLLADFPVVILDEPAEHLDEATADELTRDLLAAVAGRTVLLITHRPVAPGAVDQVLRLHAGRLVPAVSPSGNRLRSHSDLDVSEPDRSREPARLEMNDNSCDITRHMCPDSKLRPIRVPLRQGFAGLIAQVRVGRIKP
jgi:ATP-binding cassette subfamily C protein CydCD